MKRIISRTLSFAFILLSLLQCTKESETRKETVIQKREIQISFTTSENSKVDVEESPFGSLSFTWNENDKLYVFDGENYCGELKLISGAGKAEGSFNGTISEPSTGNIIFYYFGGSRVPDGTNPVTVDFSSQTGSLTGDVQKNLIARNAQKYNSSDTSYSGDLKMVFAVGKFSFSEADFGIKDNVIVRGLAQKISIDGGGNIEYLAPVSSDCAKINLKDGLTDKYIILPVKEKELDKVTFLCENVNKFRAYPNIISNNNFYTAPGKTAINVSLGDAKNCSVTYNYKTSDTAVKWETLPSESTTSASTDVTSTKPEWDLKQEGWKQFLGWAESDGGPVKYNYDNEEGGVKSISTLGKTSINLYAKWEKRILVDFDNPTFIVATESTEKRSVTKNKSTNYYFTGQKGYERLYIPIFNLEDGKWYKIQFNESIQANEWYTDYGRYAATFKETTNTNGTTDACSMLRNNVERNTRRMYYHKLTEYNHSAETSTMYFFKKSGDPVYWAWDISRTVNGVYVSMGISVNSIVPVENPTTPYIDFLESTFSNGYSFKSTDQEKEDPDVTYISDVENNNRLEYYGATKIGYERVYIPIKNYQKGHTYKITFTLDIDNNPQTSTNDRCYGFLDSNVYVTGNYHGTTGFTDQLKFKKEDSVYRYTETLETAIAFTVPTDSDKFNSLYWVVCLSDTGNDQTDFVKIYNVQLHEVTQ